MNINLNEETENQNHINPIPPGLCHCDEKNDLKKAQSTPEDTFPHNLGQGVPNSQSEQLQPNIEDSPNRVLRNNSQVQSGENPLLLRNRRTSAEDYFNSNNLQYLTQNLENLREVLQVVALNSEIAQSINSDIQSRNAFDLGTAQALNNAQTRILNSQNQVYEQLQQLRSIIDENAIREQQRRLNLLNSLIERRIFSKPFDNKGFEKLFWIGFLISVLFTISTTLIMPSFEYKIWSFVNFMNLEEQPKPFFMGLSCCFILFLFKVHQKLHQSFLAEEPVGYIREFLKLLPEYSPFYDSGFFILANLHIIENKLNFGMMLWFLVWNIFLTKNAYLVLQKLNTIIISANLGLMSDYAALKRVQYVAVIYLVLNIPTSFGVIWKIWGTSYQTSLILFGLLLLSYIEPIKILLSSFVLVRNYSLIANNNTRELRDPRFKIELCLDFIRQFIGLFTIGLLSLLHTNYMIGFIILCCLSFNNTLQKLKECFIKYSSWKKLKKKLDEMFPLVEKTETDDICSICHDALLISRKLPCGHQFHLKCLFYWIENQKTCPNCRAQVPSVY